MTVKELISVLSKFDGNIEVGVPIPESAFDKDAHGEDAEIFKLEEDDVQLKDSKLYINPMGLSYFINESAWL